MNRRHFLEAASVALAAGVVAPKGAGSTSTPSARGDWFRRSPRIYLVDFQFPDPVDQSVPGMPAFLRDLDTARLVRDAVSAHATGLLVHAKCHEGNAYYNTRIGHKHSGLGARDFLAELGPQCRRHGLTLLFYYSLWWEQRAFVEHPDWRAVGADGREQVRPLDQPLHPNGNQKWTVCLNGGYRAYATAMLEELCRGYDFDGFWLDMPGTVCFCAACQADFRSSTGSDMPGREADMESWRAFRRWRLGRNDEIHRGFVDTIHRIGPHLTVSSNGVPYDPEHSLSAAEPQDYLSREFHYPEGSLAVSLYGRKFWAVKPGTPFEIEIWRYAFPGRQGSSRGFQVRPSDVLLTEMAGVVAHGGWPQYYDQIRVDGTLDPHSVAAIGPAFAGVRDRQPWAGRGQPVPYALLLWSKSTESYSPWEVRQGHQQGLEGTHAALVERRVPVGLVTDLALQRGETRGARVVVLSEVECLSDAAVAVLHDFVDAGGGLVVTGRTSLRDETGRPRTNFALADEIGADFGAMTKTWLTFLSVPGGHPLASGVPKDFPITVNETLQAVVSPRPGTQALGAIHLPVPGFKMGAAPGPATDHPAFLWRKVGRGRVIYAAAPLGTMYFRYSLPSVRQLIVNAVEWAAAAPPPITAKAPATVEVVPWHDAANGRTVLHLVNRTGSGLGQTPGQMMHEVIPVHGIEIHVSPPFAGNHVVAQPGSRPVRFRRDVDGTTIEVPKLDIWEILEISS